MIAIRLDLRCLPLCAAMAALLAAIACGGAQRGGGGGGAAACHALSPGAGAEEAAACLVRLGGDGADACRAAVNWPLDLSPAALRDVSQCVMDAKDRGDGVWLADIMASVGDDVGRLTALASVFGGSFDTAVHGVTFTTSLDDETQHALGRALAALDPAAREALVSLALAYAVEPLATYGRSYAGEVSPDDPALVAFAERIAASDESVGEFERRVLLETGTWSAQDALSCYSRTDERCAAWEGESPLEVLAVLEFYDVGLPSTPNAALRLLRSGNVDRPSARGLATYIANAEYGNRSAMVNALMLDLTDPSIAPEIRLGIAEAAAPAMCEYEAVSGAFLRARTSDPDRLDNPSAAWPTFIAACAQRHWSIETTVAALSAGSWLGVPQSVWDSLEASLRSRTEDTACDELRALGRHGYDASPWVITRGMAHVLVSALGGQRCAPALTAPVEAVARSSAEHPEARLAAYLRLLELGDRSGCSRARALLDWHHDDYDEGPGPWAEALAAELEQRCRR